MCKRRECIYEGEIMNETEVKELIEKAHQSLEAAKLLFDEGFIDFLKFLTVPVFTVLLKFLTIPVFTVPFLFPHFLFLFRGY